jgi:hypothetical protein
MAKEMKLQTIAFTGQSSEGVKFDFTQRFL